MMRLGIAEIVILFCIGSFFLVLIGAGIYLIARKKKE
jgi:hypothetical protein